MSDAKIFKNLAPSAVQRLDALVDYQDGQVVSRTLAQRPGVSITLFAFAEGEGLTSHTASGDALVQVLEGRATITIAEAQHELGAGESILMPAEIPHAVDAPQRFKMLLTVVKP
jgi:quercetin dioxygenase-like cupin family protein